MPSLLVLMKVVGSLLQWCMCSMQSTMQRHRITVAYLGYGHLRLTYCDCIHIPPALRAPPPGCSHRRAPAARAQVSEQMDSLRVLNTDPVDYLVTPRVLACMIAGPILNVLCFCMGIAASTLLAELVYDVPANVIVDSCRRALTSFDVVTSMVKAWVFGTCIAVVGGPHLRRALLLVPCACCCCAKCSLAGWLGQASTTACAVSDGSHQQQ